MEEVMPIIICILLAASSNWCSRHLSP